MSPVRVLSVMGMFPPAGKRGKPASRPPASVHRGQEHRLAKRRDSGGWDLGHGSRDRRDTGRGPPHRAPHTACLQT